MNSVEGLPACVDQGLVGEVQDVERTHQLHGERPRMTDDNHVMGHDLTVRKAATGDNATDPSDQATTTVAIIPASEWSTTWQW
jgi:hypothetical protein